MLVQTQSPEYQSLGRIMIERYEITWYVERLIDWNAPPLIRFAVFFTIFGIIFYSWAQAKERQGLAVFLSIFIFPLLSLPLHQLSIDIYPEQFGPRFDESILEIAKAAGLYFAAIVILAAIGARLFKFSKSYISNHSCPRQVPKRI